jgi:hypothetical protein
MEEEDKLNIEFLEEFAKKILPKNVFKIKRRLADRLWSDIIRLRDHWTCCRCGHSHNPRSKGLHVSHYFSRFREFTRFAWDNCDSLCLGCHLLWSKEKRNDYTKFKKKQLGFMRYRALVENAKVPNDLKVFDDLTKIKEFRLILEQNSVILTKH